MNIRTIVLLLILLALLVFAALNWGVFTTPATLNLLFGQSREGTAAPEAQASKTVIRTAAGMALIRARRSA